MGDCQSKKKVSVEGESTKEPVNSADDLIKEQNKDKVKTPAKETVNEPSNKQVIESAKKPIKESSSCSMQVTAKYQSRELTKEKVSRIDKEDDEIELMQRFQETETSMIKITKENQRDLIGNSVEETPLKLKPVHASFCGQREIISIHIGQAGVQIGNSCWELFCLGLFSSLFHFFQLRLDIILKVFHNAIEIGIR